MAWGETDSGDIPSPQECVGENIGHGIVKIQSRPESDQIMSRGNGSVWKGIWKDVLMRHRNESFRKDGVSYANLVKGFWGEE